MVASSSKFGSATYFEFQKAGDPKAGALQLLVVPTFKNPDPTVFEMVPATFWMRNISEQHPRRAWNVTYITLTQEEKDDIINPSEALSNEQIATYAAAQLKEADVSLRGFIARDFKPIGKPVTIDLGADDLRDLAELSSQPSGLTRRVLRARETAGYPENIIPPVSK